MTSDISIDLPHWHQILDRVLSMRSAREDGDIDYPQLVGEELSTAQVAELLVIFIEVIAAAGMAKRAITDELARRMASEERTAIEAAGTLVTWKPTKKTRVTNTDGFWKYMLANPDLIPLAFNPNNIRKTGIPSSVFDTFFEDVVGVDPVIDTIPLTVIEENRNKKRRQP